MVESLGCFRVSFRIPGILKFRAGADVYPMILKRSKRASDGADIAGLRASTQVWLRTLFCRTSCLQFI
jgi:hypothetical protein